MVRIDRLSIDKDDRKLYDELDSEDMLRFKDHGGERTRKEQFLFSMAIGFKISMAIGFKNKIKQPIKTREGFFLTKDLRAEDETLMNVIAMYDSDSIDILSDQNKVFEISEEYAHAGILVLSQKIASIQYGTFDKLFEIKLYEILNEYEE